MSVRPDEGHIKLEHYRVLDVEEIRAGRKLMLDLRDSLLSARESVVHDKLERERERNNEVTQRLGEERNKLCAQIEQANRNRSHELRLAAEKELKADTERRTRAQEAIDMATSYGFKSDNQIHYPSVGMAAIRFMRDKLREQSKVIAQLDCQKCRNRHDDDI